MKYSPQNYALALSSVLAKSKEDKVVFSNFLKVVKKNGDQKILPKILNAFKKIEIKKKGGSHIKIEFAHEPEAAQLKSITKEFGSHDLIETTTNPSLVAGVRITFDEEREIDNSLARKLHKLFK